MIDINIVRGLLTGLMMLAFIGICIWSYSKARKVSFDEAARLPLEEDAHE